MALEPQINQTSIDDAFFALLTITSGHEDIADQEKEYLVNNNEAVTSRGQVYRPYAFTITLPTEDLDQPMSVQIVIDNVDRRITEFVRALLEPPTFKIEVIISSDPDTVERRIDFMKLADVTYDAMTVTGTLVPTNPLSRPCIDSTYNGTEFPDLVYGVNG